MKNFLLGMATGAIVGSTATAVTLFCAAIKSPSISEGMKDATADRVTKFLYGDVVRRPGAHGYAMRPSSTS